MEYLKIQIFILYTATSLSQKMNHMWFQLQIMVLTFAVLLKKIIFLEHNSIPKKARPLVEKF